MAGDKKLLIIDSKASRRDTLASRFRLQGFYVELSNSGFHSLSQIEKYDFDSVVIQGNLFDMSAIELIGLMRGVFRKDELQIIYVDKKASQEEILELYKLGINEFIVYSEKIFGSLLDKIEPFKPRKDRSPRSIMNPEPEDSTQ
ncbi:response regulator [Bacteriovorax sp. DB6_IX]|uniref:response regulator n=1 Tax=Bacteriovorax sp. DB6_IX TaxID=1353530 RepID=UPI00038A1884|nr:response regulator [Bacteriovorax sp. DB6_IX]EQC52521.1 response regulator receiver domain protein [Bacteriovorax sp. DB6_IX]